MRTRKAHSGILAFAACLTMFLSFVPVGASAGGWQSFSDSRYGMKVSIPSTWQTVPPSVAGVNARVATLQKENQAGLASVYAGFIATPAAKKQTLSYYFQAFQYAPKSKVQPDLALSVARTTAQVAGDKKALAASFAHSYPSSHPGTTISKQTVVNVPAGQAALIEGRQTSTTADTQFQIYILSKGPLIFVFSFRAAPGDLAADAVFSGVMKRFAFS